MVVASTTATVAATAAAHTSRPANSGVCQTCPGSCIETGRPAVTCVCTRWERLCSASRIDRCVHAHAAWQHSFAHTRRHERKSRRVSGR